MYPEEFNRILYRLGFLELNAWLLKSKVSGRLSILEVTFISVANISLIRPLNRSRLVNELVNTMKE